MEGKICSIVLWHFKFFRFLCFTSISLSRNRRTARRIEFYLPLWTICLIIIINAVTYYFYTYQSSNSGAVDYFGNVVSYIKIFTTAIIIQLTILEPLFKRKHERAFWNYYIRLTTSRQLVSASIWTQIKEYKYFLLKFYAYCLTVQVIEIILIFHYGKLSGVENVLWIVFLPYTYFLRCRTMHLMFHLDLISNEILVLDKDLQLLVDYTEFELCRPTFPKFDEYIRMEIVERQQRYEDIFGMVDSFKRACGFSIIANYFKYYMTVLVGCYWFYFSWYNSHLTAKDILLIPAILEIPMFLLTAKNCMKAAQFISYRVHSLRHNAENIAVSTQIQNFSLQLLHQQIKIDGLGIAAMDGYMLTKAVGSITTYMVFFIQFMPKFKSKFD